MGFEGRNMYKRDRKNYSNVDKCELYMKAHLNDSSSCCCAELALLAELLSECSWQ